ncbi:molybdopterin-dependent oxidoreductase [Prauserella cavernicola]|uniref:Molybdopterin-dependent oxidoreductase n=1 Tax=Prauserella cavernicola TaxID=2800127 RepID=A0A934QNW8_9PSEU|nr:molybdopterin-dependent oxidoreductase [Prauserella cavernicola]MBK1783034.1 molybdopterin-dependent oxidoreductase [Prauserella cavernicola]
MSGSTGTWRSTTSHWGAYRARTTEAGELEIAPHPLDANPSPLLGNVAGSVRHATRVRAPAVRRGWLDHGPGRGEGRGREEFVEVSWDTALDLVAGELDRVRREHGNEAIFGGSYGWGSAGRFHHTQSQLHRLLNLAGGYTASRGTYSHGTSTVLLPHVLGDAATVLYRADTWDTIARHTDLVVAFGGLALKNVSVTPGGTTGHATATALHALAGSGVELAVVTPLGSDVPAAPNARWLPVAPASDVALMLGLAHTLLTENLHDSTFLDSHCTGFDTVAEYLLGSDGTVKGAEWAAERCGLPADEIRTLARRMASGRTLVTVSWSLQRTRHGEQPVWAGVLLAAMLGQIGLPGGGFGHGYGSIGHVGEDGPLLPLPTLPQGHNPVPAFIPVARIADALLHPGRSYDFDGAALTYPDLRLVYWAGGNPFHHHQDLARLRRAFERPDTVVVHETHWTATARHADIVLPATTTLEREDLGSGRRDTHVIAMHRVLEPFADARDDYAILTGVAERLGLGQRFTEGRTPREWLAHLYGEWRDRLADSGHEAPDFDRFWADGEWRLPAEREHPTPFAEFRADPERTPLNTPSGRVELFSPAVAGFGYADCPGHPTWLEPESDEDHPLWLIANQPGTRLHGQGDVGATSQGAKIGGREPITLHPADAAERGVGEGDVVRVFTDRGACLAGARLDDGLRRGVVVLATGAWFAPVEDPRRPGGTLCAHGNPNVLIADVPTSRLAQGCAAQHTRVQVERFDGPLPAVDSLRPPPIATA